MLCVPEGGMNFDWDLTYIIDGECSFSIWKERGWTLL